MPGANARLRRR